MYQIRLTETALKNVGTEDKPYELRIRGYAGLVLRVEPTGKRLWYYVAQIGSGALRRRVRERMGDAEALSLEDVQDEHRRLAGLVARGVHPADHRKALALAAARRRSRTLDALLDEKKGRYTEYAKVSLKDGTGTVRRLRSSFADLLELELGNITPDIVDRWKVAQLKKPRTASGINRDLAALKSLLNRAVSWGLIEHSPLAGYKRLAEDNNHKPVALTDAQLKRLKQSLRKGPVYLRVMALLALETGLRRGEAMKLHWSDIDLSAATLTVKGTTTKTGTTRHIPLSRKAARVLRYWRGHDGATPLRTRPVFPSPKIPDRPISTTKTAWATVCDRAKLAGSARRFHALRHTVATRLVNANVPVTVVKELLGHSSLNVTQKYTVPHEEQLRAAVDIRSRKHG